MINEEGYSYKDGILHSEGMPVWLESCFPLTVYLCIEIPLHENPCMKLTLPSQNCCSVIHGNAEDLAN